MNRTGKTQRIGKRIVDALLPGQVAWDSEVTGFGVRRQSVGKFYILKYRVGRQQRWYSIGKHGSPWTPESARKEARRLLGLVAENRDPADLKADSANDITLSELCDRYLKDAPLIVLPSKGRPKKASSLATDRSNIERHIVPLLGRKRIRGIKRNDIERFQRDVAAGKTAADERTGPRGRAIVKGGKGTAARATAVLGAIFSYAVGQGLVAENPARGIALFKNEPRTRFLTTDELARLGSALADAERGKENPLAIAAIRLLMLTGCRKSEISELQWKYVDFDHGCLCLPDSKTGAKFVPLAAPALEVLASLPRIDGNPHVFPSEKRHGHYVGLPKAWRRLRERAGPQHNYQQNNLQREDIIQY